MQEKRTFWVHPSSYTYSLVPPDRLIEMIWTERPGWGFLRRRDLWVERTCTLEELIQEGYFERKPATDPEVLICPHCSMYICGIPGFLVHKHVLECGGSDEDWLKLEDMMVSGERLRIHENKLLTEKRRLQEEREEAERQERFDRVKEEMQTRQLGKDRKKRLREQTKDELRKR